MELFHLMNTSLWLAVALGAAGVLLALYVRGRPPRNEADPPPGPAQQWWSEEDDDNHPLFARS